MKNRSWLRYFDKRIRESIKNKVFQFWTSFWIKKYFSNQLPKSSLAHWIPLTSSNLRTRIAAMCVWAKPRCTNQNCVRRLIFQGEKYERTCSLWAIWSDINRITRFQHLALIESSILWFQIPRNSRSLVHIWVQPHTMRSAPGSRYYLLCNLNASPPYSLNSILA